MLHKCITKMSETYYDILGVTKESTDIEIKKAYQHIIKNRMGEVDIKLLNKAYSTLRNPKLRKEYDENNGEENTMNWLSLKNQSRDFLNSIKTHEVKEPIVFEEKKEIKMTYEELSKMTENRMKENRIMDIDIEKKQINIDPKHMIEPPKKIVNECKEKLDDDVKKFMEQRMLDLTIKKYDTTSEIIEQKQRNIGNNIYTFLEDQSVNDEDRQNPNIFVDNKYTFLEDQYDGKECAYNIMCSEEEYKKFNNKTQKELSDLSVASYKMMIMTREQEEIEFMPEKLNVKKNQ